MAEHLVQLWIRSDDDPSGIDWQAWLPKSVNVEHVQTRSFPWRDVQHEITWWITRRLTPEDWSELDNAEYEVLGRIVGDDHFAGTAGPRFLTRRVSTSPAARTNTGRRPIPTRSPMRWFRVAPPFGRIAAICCAAFSNS